MTVWCAGLDETHPNLHTKQSSIQNVYCLVCRSGWDSSKPAPQTLYTLYRWPFGVQVWMRFIQTCTPNSHLYRMYSVWCAGLDETHPNLHTKQSSIQNVYCLVCRSGWDSSKPARQTVIYTEWHIPDVVLIQLILLMMGTWLPETCRE